MNNNVKTGIAIILILGACFWVYGKYQSTRLGAVANNGNDGETPEISEATRDKMRQAWEKRPPRTEQGPPTEEERTKMREAFEKELSPADREVMKKAQTERERSRAVTKAALSPEEQKALEQKMRGRRGGGRRGGPGGPGGFGGPGGAMGGPPPPDGSR